MKQTVMVKNPFPGKFDVLSADVQDVPALHNVRMTLGAHMSVDLSTREARAIARALLSVADISDYLDADDTDSAAGTSVRRISNGTTAYYLNDADGHTYTGYERVTSQDPSHPGTGNYVVFEGLTGNVASIRVAAIYTPGG